jgi:FMN phosphatase YigB (HAD superfamily)
VASIFSSSLTVNLLSFYKPHLATYASILSALDVKPEDALFVAGSSGDVVGAAGAGMRVVWNNHVGLTAKSGSSPLREGKSLDESLVDILGTEV